MSNCNRMTVYIWATPGPGESFGRAHCTVLYGNKNLGVLSWRIPNYRLLPRSELFERIF